MEAAVPMTMPTLMDLPFFEAALIILRSLVCNHWRSHQMVDYLQATRSSHWNRSLHWREWKVCVGSEIGLISSTIGGNIRRDFFLIKAISICFLAMIFNFSGNRIQSQTQWHPIVCWIVYSFFSIIEVFNDLLLYWIQFYFTFKNLAFLFWAMLHQTNGTKFFVWYILQGFFEKERVQNWWSTQWCQEECEQCGERVGVGFCGDKCCENGGGFEDGSEWLIDEARILYMRWFFYFW